MTNPAFRKTKRSLPIALLRAREQVMEPIRAMLADSGVTEQKWRVLRVLEEAGEIEPTVIAREACLHLPSLSRILKTMEQDGLVQRREDEQDRRKTVIAISGVGAGRARHPQRARGAVCGHPRRYRAPSGCGEDRGYARPARRADGRS